MVPLWQGSSITFKPGAKNIEIGKVAGHRLETQLKKNQNLLLNYKGNIFPVDLEEKHLMKAYLDN